MITSSVMMTEVTHYNLSCSETEDKVWRELKRVNARKAAGPNGITGHVVRSCADLLYGLFTSIFN